MELSKWISSTILKQRTDSLPMSPGFPAHYANGFSVRVAVQFQLFMVPLTFPVQFDRFHRSRGSARLQAVKVAQFVHQVLYEVVLCEAHFAKDL